MPPSVTAPRHPAIALDGVTLAYGSTPVLRDLTLRLDGGTLTALVGPNGSGKSSLLNAIAGLLPPIAGTILIHGAPPAQRRRQIAYVQQRTEDNRLLPISGREVVNMGRYAHLGLLRRFSDTDR
ncbi:MAG TPA: ATP-binding cassette domain-containing protein, partial [Euzebya sp.]|nr:ATP-binding cassette domain-containing protein [Euzebya sp.]